MSGNCPGPNETNIPRIVLAVRDLFAGRSNRTGAFTMAAAATKTVSAPNCGAKSVIHLQATNAAAGTLQGSAKHLYVSTKAIGSFTVATASAASAAGTETFDYAIES